MKLKNSLKGFTLVEVLIVIIIVGILIAALLPRLTGSQQRARNTARTAAVNQVAQAMGLMIADDGALAESGTVAAPGNVACADLTTTTAAGTVTLADYLTSVPADPNNSTHGGCNPGEWPFYSEDGNQAYVFAELEGTNQGNATGVVTNTEAGYNTALGTNGNFFGVLVRG